MALVNAAKQFGYEFKGKDMHDNIEILNKHKQATINFKLLNVCEFTSARKRMSVIIQEDANDDIWLFCKGADSVIKSRLSANSAGGAILKQTEEHVD